MSSDDQHLLAALRKRDADAFAALFELYSDRMYRLAAGILGNDDEADGVVQDVFMKLIENLDHFEGRSKLGTWLYRATHNASIDRLRARKPMQSIADEYDFDAAADLPLPTVLIDWSNAPETTVSSEEAQHVIHEAVQALPITLRSTFILREIEGLSTAETAGTLGISTSAVKVRLHRARLAMREQLSIYFSERLQDTSEQT